MKLHWSPADLGRQRRLVRGLAIRADIDRRHLGAVRRQWVTSIGGTPRGLVGCFVAGLAVGGVRRPSARPSDRQRDGSVGPVRAFLLALLWLPRAVGAVETILRVRARREADPPPADPGDSP